jgi:hypothetical protein
LDLTDQDGKWRKWTIVLGDNGTGKTSLLQLFAAIESAPVKYTDNESVFFARGFSSFINQLKVPFDAENNTQGSAGFYIASIKNNPYGGGMPHLHLNFDSNYQSGSGTSGLVEDAYKELKCYGYGANRFMSSNALTESQSTNSETLFNDDAKLINAEEWFLQLDYAASKESDVKAFAVRKREQVRQILLDILPDIEDIRVTAPTKNNLRQTVELKTPYNWVTIHQLSLGYRTMVAWMVDLASRLFDRYPDSDNPLAEPAIVLIDEIDLHLHPKWQRKIFNYLDEKFPATQFIVSAHSPLVVQSAPSDANIVLLKREGDHVVIDQDIKSVRSWRLDQILSSDLFGVGSRSLEIETLMEERRKLIQKDNLSSKERSRLEELNSIEYNLPTAESKTDLEAMEVIRKAADYLKTRK